MIIHLYQTVIQRARIFYGNTIDTALSESDESIMLQARCKMSDGHVGEHVVRQEGGR